MLADSTGARAEGCRISMWNEIKRWRRSGLWEDIIQI